MKKQRSREVETGEEVEVGVELVCFGCPSLLLIFVPHTHTLLKLFICSVAHKIIIERLIKTIFRIINPFFSTSHVDIVGKFHFFIIKCHFHLCYDLFQTNVFLNYDPLQTVMLFGLFTQEGWEKWRKIEQLYNSYRVITNVKNFDT